MRNNITDYGLLLLLALIWSTSFLLIKVGVETIPPFSLTAGRLCIAALIFWSYLGFRGEGIPLHRRALILYFVVGIMGSSLPFVLISWGETRISSSLTAMLMGIMPIGTFVLAHIFISSEPMTRRKTLGVSLGFSGLLVLVGLSALGTLGDSLIGQFSVLGGAVCYAIATVFVRTQPSFEGYKMAAGMNTVAAIVSLVLAFSMENPTQLQPDTSALWALITLGVFPTAIASLIYFRIIKNLGANTFAQINYIVPVLGGAWGMLVLGESLGWNVFIALFLVLCGVYLIQSKSVG
jgi:drug/metabolite transporter (DMT)-like permease